MSKPKDWKTYEEFAAGIAANRLPASPALDQRRLAIRQSKETLELDFVGPDRVRWRIGGAQGEDGCDVVEVAPQTFFLDMAFADRPREALTAVINLVTRRTLTIRSVVAAAFTPGEPQVSQMFEAGELGDGGAGPAPPPSGAPPAPSRDLIGLRAHYRYSPNHLYEHTYLSSERYCWQCLQGEQRGHGDVDLATVYRFAADQYVFAFREFKIPVASVFFLNFQDLNSTGKFLGLTSDGRVENRKAGAFVQRVSQTFYDAAVQPV